MLCGVLGDESHQLYKPAYLLFPLRKKHTRTTEYEIVHPCLSSGDFQLTALQTKPAYPRITKTQMNDLASVCNTLLAIVISTQRTFAYRVPIQSYIDNADQFISISTIVARVSHLYTALKFSFFLPFEVSAKFSRDL